MIRLAEADLPLNERLDVVRKITRETLRWAKGPAGFGLGALPLTGFSTTVGVGVMYLVNAICGKGGVEMGAAVMAAHVASTAIATQRRKD